MIKKYFLPSLFLTAFFLFAKFVFACHSVPLVNYSVVFSGTDIIINGSSDAATNGCTSDYRMVVQLECITQTVSFQGWFTSSSLPLTGPKPPQLMPYPTITIDMLTLCPGTTYKMRVGDYNAALPSINAVSWMPVVTFTTPGLPPSFGNLVINSSANMICAGDSVDLSVSFSAGCGPTGITWDNNLGAGINKRVYPTSNTTYTVTVFDTCTSSALTASIFIGVDNPIAGIATKSTSDLCFGDTAILTISGYYGNIQWQVNDQSAWQDIPGAVSSTFLVVNDGSLSGTKWYRARVGTSCTLSEVLANSLSLNFKNKVVVQLSDTSICHGTSATLTALPQVFGGNYVWFSGQTTGSVTVTPNETVDYWLIYTLAGCKSDTTWANVAIKTDVGIQLSEAVICKGENATLAATPEYPGGNYVWSTGQSTGSISVAPNQTSDYWLVYSYFGCVSDTTWTTVHVQTDVPQISFIHNTSADVCEGDSILLSALVSLMGGSYEWSNGETAPSFYVLPTSDTTFWLDYTFGYCSVRSDTTYVAVNPWPNVELAVFDTICLNVPPFALSGGSPPGDQYVTPGLRFGLFNPSLVGPGEHVVTYNYTDPKGCSGSAENILVVDECLSVEKNGNKGIIANVYPNPSPGNFKIELFSDVSQNIELMMYDLSGKLVLKEKAELSPGLNSIEINNNKLSAGNYLLKFLSQGSVGYKRIIKE